MTCLWPIGSFGGIGQPELSISSERPFGQSARKPCGFDVPFRVQTALMPDSARFQVVQSTDIAQALSLYEVILVFVSIVACLIAI